MGQRHFYAWGPRKAKAGDPVQADGRSFTVDLVLWVDVTHRPKRTRLWLAPSSSPPRGPTVELCACVQCMAGKHRCFVSAGEPSWDERMAMAGVGPQGPEYASREQRRKDKGW